MIAAPRRTSEAENGHSPEPDREATGLRNAFPPSRLTQAASAEQPLLLATVAIGLFWAVQATNFSDTQWWTAGLMLAGVLVGVLVVRGVTYAPWAVLALTVVIGVSDRIVRTPFVGSDVGTATEEAIAVLRDGGNPYGHYFSSAEGMIPYPPGELFFYAIPHAIFGSINRVDQWAGIGIVILLAALAPLVGPARAALATALYATFGLAAYLSMDGSNDTSLAFLIVLSVVLLSWSERVSRTAKLLFYASAFTFAWALLFKQFTVLLFPFIVLYLRQRGADWKKYAAVSAGLAVLVVLPFFLTEPAGFKRNMLDIAYVHQDVWGLNAWAALEDVAPGLVDRLHGAIPFVNFLGVAIVGVALALRPASNLGTALFQGLGLLFVALFLGRWTTSPYYTGPAGVLAVAMALVNIPALVPHPTEARQPVSILGERWRRWSLSIAALPSTLRSRGLTPAVPAAAALTLALFVGLLAWTSGWVTSARSAGGPFVVLRPDVTLVEGQMSVVTSFTMQRDEDVRGWFFLSKPGESEPWANFSYQSSVVEQNMVAGQPALFHWSEIVDIPDGTYDLSIWFHKRVGNRWVHLYGGGPASMSLAVKDGSTWTVGPYTIAVDPALAPLTAGRNNPIALNVTNTASGAECRARWHLRPLTSAEPLVSGESADCSKLDVDLPASLSPGSYTLEITALAVNDRSSEESDRLSVPVEVKPSATPAPSVQLTAAALPPLKAGQSTAIELTISGVPEETTCRTRWRISVEGGGRPIAFGEGGDCTGAEISLPATLQPGNYNLELFAVLETGDHSEESPPLILPVVVE